MTIFNTKQKKFKVINVLNTWVLKLMQTLFGNIMLMIFSLNWIEPMLYFSE